MWVSWIHLCTVIILLQKQSAGSNIKGWLCIHAYLRRIWIKLKHILCCLILLNLQHYNHSLLSYDHSQVIYTLPLESKVWVSFFLVTFQPLCEKITKCYCIASSIHNLFHMVYNEVHDEVNTFTSSSHKEHKITRHTTFSLTCFEEDGLLYTRKPKFSSPDYIFVSLCYVLDS